MTKRTKLCLLHWVDTFLFVAIAGGVAAFMAGPMARMCRTCADRLAILGQYGTIIAVVVVSMLVGSILGNCCLAAIRGLRFLPFHFGIIPKILLALIVCILLQAGWIAPVMATPAIVNDLVTLVIWIFVGVLIVPILRNILSWKSKTQPQKSVKKTNDLEVWLSHDAPVGEDQPNLVPSHQAIAERILKRLGGGVTDGIPPNVAILGAYGSGKTSICNMVKKAYHQNKTTTSKKTPKMIFCHFEAWQYLTPEAAVRSLIDVAVSEISNHVEAAELWRIPEHYVRAIGEVAGGWVNTIAKNVSQQTPSNQVLSVIGDVLQRLDTRLVMFVDDLDRIEATSPEAKQALVQALNQLQKVPNLQYVLAIGPPMEWQVDSKVVGLDLLKLTRFQELVPPLKPETVFDWLNEFKALALADTTYYFPWAEMLENSEGPLEWQEWYPRLGPRIPVTLVSLLDTPRSLKNTLRETSAAWDGGLKGEINWHDLLLLFTLKSAEPALYEMIVREPQTFLDGGGYGAIINPDGQKDVAKDFEERITKLLRNNNDTHRKAAMDAIKQLFPQVNTLLSKSLGSKAINSNPIRWNHCYQNLTSEAAGGRNYLERALSGCLDKNEIQDQPTLQYIKALKDGRNFDPSEFVERYLITPEKLSREMEKFVQFAQLIPLNIALDIANCIMDWMAEPNNALPWAGNIRSELYGKGTRYAREIIIQANRHNQQDTAETISARSELIAQWLEDIVSKYGNSAWYISSDVLEIGDWGISPDKIVNLRKNLVETLRRVYVEEDRAFLVALEPDIFLIYDFVRLLVNHPDYPKVKTKFTNKIIEEADTDESGQLKARILISLASLSNPITDGPCPPDLYKIGCNLKNEANYNMEAIKAALGRWKGQPIPHPLAARVYQKLCEVYEIA